MRAGKKIAQTKHRGSRETGEQGGGEETLPPQAGGVGGGNLVARDKWQVAGERRGRETAGKNTSPWGEVVTL